jgi:hypothetical protein
MGERRALNVLRRARRKPLKARRLADVERRARREIFEKAFESLIWTPMMDVHMTITRGKVLRVFGSPSAAYPFVWSVVDEGRTPQRDSEHACSSIEEGKRRAFMALWGRR